MARAMRLEHTEQYALKRGLDELDSPLDADSELVKNLQLAASLASRNSELLTDKQMDIFRDVVQNRKRYEEALRLCPGLARVMPQIEEKFKYYTSEGAISFGLKMLRQRGVSLEAYAGQIREYEDSLKKKKNRGNNSGR